MTERPAAISARFSTFKNVSGRGVCQLICEIPIEHASHMLDTLGYPLPAEEIVVAIARIQEPAE